MVDKISIGNGADVVYYLKYFLQESKTRSIDVEVIALEQITRQLMCSGRFAPQQAADAVMHFLVFRRRQISIELLTNLQRLGLDVRQPLAYLNEPVADQEAVARALYYFRATEDYDKHSELYVGLFTNLPKVSEGRALDFGCGTGALGPLLRRHGYTFLHGVDISPEMIEVCRRKGFYDQLTTSSIADFSPPPWRVRPRHRQSGPAPYSCRSKRALYPHCAGLRTAGGPSGV